MKHFTPFNMLDFYKLSLYTIFIELKQADDQYLLVHGYTGAIDIANGSIVRHLKSHRNHLIPQESPFSINTFQLLLKRGYITDKNQDEEIIHVKKLAELLHRRDSILHKNFMFIISYDCNFRCPYCYENGISHNGRQWTKKQFDRQMVDRVFKAMLEIEPHQELHDKHITLYGGEPLLKENKEIVQYIVKKGRELGYVFEAITNGYDLLEFEDLLGPDQIRFLQITVDGAKKQHNKRRIHYTDKETFDRIIQNIDIALRHEVEVSVRVNTDADNYQDLETLTTLFDSLGYSQNKNFMFYSALLMDYEVPEEKKRQTQQRCAQNGSSTFHYMTHLEFNRKHQNSGYICQDTNVIKKIYTAMQDKKPLRLHSIYCSAQSGEYLFDPYGDIYGCWSHVGKPESALGHIGDSHIEWTKIREEWQERHTGKSESCSRCKYVFLCSGGCYFKAKLYNGINSTFCFNYPDTFKHAANKAYEKYYGLVKHADK